MTSEHDDEFELDALKQAMRSATPSPDPARRQENLRVAAENFDQAQGTAQAPRQNSTQPRERGFIKGVLKMFANRSLATGLTATTALVAVGFVFLTPYGQGMLRQSGRVGEAPVLGTTTANTELPKSTPEVSDDAFFVGSIVVLNEEAAEVDVLREDAPGSLASQSVVEAEAADMSAPAEPLALAAPSPVAEARRSQSVVAGYVAEKDTDIRVIPNDREEFASEAPSSLKITSEEPVSTFSIDVDTASYSVVRSMLQRGQLPPRDAVRIEEMINYFDYAYAAPEVDELSPFRPTISVSQTPWNPDTRLVRIGLQGKMPAVEDRPPLNLVFLIDTSGSMDDPAKLPLLVQSFRLMLGRLSAQDQVAIVTYAGSAGVALEPTSAANRPAIERALLNLHAGGSTNGVGGLQSAYRLANEMAEEGEVSRVLLATDGDFNVGISNPDALSEFIASQRESGTYLSVLGFGRGNLQDDTMQALAQNGNGTAAYIDTLSEAQKVLVDQLSGALYPIANDVKIQVEFNPATVAEYRLIGYETRALRREDFNNDRVDAGELGAGHAVTAIYEITPTDSAVRLIDPLRYGTSAPEAESDAAPHDNEFGFLRLRWKEPGAEASQLVEFPILKDHGTDAEAEFAAAIAGFGELLRGSQYLGGWGYADAIALANANRGEDAFGYRNEAVQLMRLAETLIAR